MIDERSWLDRVGERPLRAAVYCLLGARCVWMSVWLIPARAMIAWHLNWERWFRACDEVWRRPLVLVFRAAIAVQRRAAPFVCDRLRDFDWFEDLFGDD